MKTSILALAVAALFVGCASSKPAEKPAEAPAAEAPAAEAAPAAEVAPAPAGG